MPSSIALRASAAVLLLVGLSALVDGCVNGRHDAHRAVLTPEDARALIERTLPRGVSDRKGWAADIYAALAALSIEPSRDNACAVAAIIAQESNFKVDPPIPGLGAMAWKEIDTRAEHASVPRMLVHGVLQMKSPNGRTYAERIDSARTEHELSNIYEDFIGSVPLGRTLFEDHNPIRTRGPMQVHVAFAAHFNALRKYPYPMKDGVDEELFTRRGGIYFGVAHLLAYPAPYDRYLYRFADFNAGQYASRNAAFQSALARAAGTSLVSDGALLAHDTDVKNAGSTEAAARSLRPRLALSDSEIHSALDQGKAENFEDTVLYRRVFDLGAKAAGRPLPSATIPQIDLRGPKITRKLTTEWYAERVDGRFQACLARVQD